MHIGSARHLDGWKVGQMDVGPGWTLGFEWILGLGWTWNGKQWQGMASRWMQSAK